MLTQERLKQALQYDPLSGVFTWITAPGYRRDLDGKVAGVRQKDRRIEIMLDYVNYRAHRLAFLYMMGEWPKQEVDHKDGDAANNSWSNLRDVSRTLNQQNLRKAHHDNKTGYLGVVQRGSKYRAVICVNRKRHFLGTFDTAEIAHEAYLAAKRNLHESCTI